MVPPRVGRVSGFVLVGVVAAAVAVIILNADGVVSFGLLGVWSISSLLPGLLL